jgi:hypothetical protein
MSSSVDRLMPRYIRLSGEMADKAILDNLHTAYPEARIVHAFASTEAGLAFEVPDGLAGFPASLIGMMDSGVEMKNPRWLAPHPFTTNCHLLSG